MGGGGPPCIASQCLALLLHHWVLLLYSTCHSLLLIAAILCLAPAAGAAGDLPPAASTHPPAYAPTYSRTYPGHQPRCVRCDTPGCFTWHITNLHHPADTYNVRVDEEGVALVVSTTNKKYAHAGGWLWGWLLWHRLAHSACLDQQHTGPEKRLFSFSPCAFLVGRMMIFDDYDGQQHTN